MPYREQDDRNAYMKDYRQSINPEENTARQRLQVEFQRFSEKIGKQYFIFACWQVSLSQEDLAELVPLARAFKDISVLTSVLTKAFNKKGRLVNRGPILIGGYGPHKIFKVLFLVKKGSEKGNFSLNVLLTVDTTVKPKISKEYREELEELIQKSRWHDINADLIIKEEEVLGFRLKAMVWLPFAEIDRYFLEAPSRVQGKFEQRSAKYGPALSPDFQITPHFLFPDLSKHPTKVNGRPRRIFDSVK